MSFTYDASLLDHPTSGPLMRVRLALGDTDSLNPHLDDDEIKHYISSLGGERRATVASAEAIAMRYAHEATFSVGQHKEDVANRAKQFAELAATLRKRYGVGLSGPWGLVPTDTYFDKSQLQADADNFTSAAE